MRLAARIYMQPLTGKPADFDLLFVHVDNFDVISAFGIICNSQIESHEPPAGTVMHFRFVELTNTTWVPEFTHFPPWSLPAN